MELSRTTCCEKEEAPWDADNRGAGAPIAGDRRIAGSWSVRSDCGAAWCCAGLSRRGAADHVHQRPVTLRLTLPKAVVEVDPRLSVGPALNFREQSVIRAASPVACLALRNALASTVPQCSASFCGELTAIQSGCSPSVYRKRKTSAQIRLETSPPGAASRQRTRCQQLGCDSDTVRRLPEEGTLFYLRSKAALTSSGAASLERPNKPIAEPPISG